MQCAYPLMGPAPLFIHHLPFSSKQFPEIFHSAPCGVCILGIMTRAICDFVSSDKRHFMAPLSQCVSTPRYSSHQYLLLRPPVFLRRAAQSFLFSFSFGNLLSHSRQRFALLAARIAAAAAAAAVRLCFR